jgi:hypothetical protein
MKTVHAQEVQDERPTKRQRCEEVESEVLLCLLVDIFLRISARKGDCTGSFASGK